MRIGSVCSGYEGIGLAVHEVLGGELAWVADNDEGASAILAHRFPSVKNLGDITAVDWAAVEPVDVLTAGFPCQDVSQAGARAGLRAGTRSGVWLEVVKAIRALRPQLVLIENVRGLLTARGDEPTPEHLAAEAARDLTVNLLDWLATAEAVARSKGDVRRAKQCRARTARVMGLRKRAVARCQWHERRLVRAIGTVLGSLAGLGFDAEWCVVSAAEAGAPHRRERVFIAAWPAADAADCGRPERDHGSHAVTAGRRRAVAGDDRGGRLAAADPERIRCEGGGSATGTGQGRPGAPGVGCGPADSGLALADANVAAGDERGLAAPGQAESGRSWADAGGRGGTPAADTCGKGLEVRPVKHHGPQRQAAQRGRGDDAPADAECDRQPGRPESAARTPDEPGQGSRAETAGCCPGAVADAVRGGRGRHSCDEGGGTDPASYC